jgi:hypothetical protein
MKWALMKRVQCYSTVLFISFWSFFSATLLAKEALPDMAFLEYLAELVEVDGELIGPQDLNNKTIKPIIKKINTTKALKTGNKKDKKEENTNNKLKDLNDNKQEDK